MSTKNASSQSSIFSFFQPVNQPNDSQKNISPQKSIEKRPHKDIVNKTEENQKLERELAPISKTAPPKMKKDKESEILEKKMEQNINSMMNGISETKKPKKKLIKNKKIITDSDKDSDFILDDESEDEKEKESIDEVSTPVKTNKKK